MIYDKTRMAIAGGNLVSFVPGMSPQEKEDVLDLLMYADFFASQTYDRRVLWKSWLDYYRNRLVRHGCLLKSLIVRAPAVITDPRELDQLTFKVVGAHGSAALASLIQASFRTIRINEFAREFFQQGTGAGRIGSLQIVPCEKTADGQIKIFLCALQVNAQAITDGGWFWDTTRRDLVLHLVGGVYDFSSDRYAASRTEIRSKLIQNSSRSIKELDI